MVVDMTILEVVEEAVDKSTAVEEVEGEGIAAGGDNWDLDSSEEETKRLEHNVAVVMEQDSDLVVAAEERRSEAGMAYRKPFIPT